MYSETCRLTWLICVNKVLTVRFSEMLGPIEPDMNPVNKRAY